MKCINQLADGVTGVSNDFIDHVMECANGEYVKIFLYLLRHDGEEVTAENVADALHYTEADVLCAFSYWKKAGMIEDSDEEEDDRSGDETEHQTVEETEASSSSDLAKLDGDDVFARLLYIAQKYMGRTFSPADVKILGNLYGSLGMSAELIEYLMEVCAITGHRSMNYAEKVACEWQKRGIRTPDGAKSLEKALNADIYEVIRTMGLSGRILADEERDYVEKWYRVCGFSRELVIEACRRTVLYAKQPSFPYADRILAEWKNADVKTLTDVEDLDKKREKAERAAEEQTIKKKGRSKNRFHNLEEHGYDYDKLVWDIFRAEDTLPEKKGTDSAN